MEDIKSWRQKQQKEETAARVVEDGLGADEFDGASEHDTNALRHIWLAHEVRQKREKNGGKFHDLCISRTPLGSS